MEFFYNYDILVHTIHLSRLRNCFEANSINNKTKKSILLSLILNDVYKLYSFCIFQPMWTILVHFKHYRICWKTISTRKSHILRPGIGFIRHENRAKKTWHNEGERLRDLPSKCGFPAKLEVVIQVIFLVRFGIKIIQDCLL